jgi:NhaP-type Na+/H+ or K+/H+ antiporter
VGEALLNDGMALVLFEALITPEFDTPVKILYYFLRVLFISPFLGCAFGVGKESAK